MIDPRTVIKAAQTLVKEAHRRGTIWDQGEPQQLWCIPDASFQALSQALRDYESQEK